VAVYAYKATTTEGSIVEGVIEALDERTAIERLRDSGFIPLRIAAPGEEKRRFVFRSPKGDVLTFTVELSVLLSAGLPLDRSLNILSEISEGAEIKNIVQSILKSIRGGSSFSDALQMHPKLFSKLYVNMIRAGESSGAIDAVLEKLGEFIESTKELKESIFSAMIYPTILFITGGLSIAVLLTYVLPKFSTIFAELGGALPLPTQILLFVSNALKDLWWLGLLLMAGMWLIIKSYIKSDYGRYKWDVLKLRLFGDIIRKLETARFCRTLGILIKSGVPLIQALSNARDVVSNRVMASAIDNVLKGVKGGKGIAATLSESNIFPSLALSMIKVGEETGQLDNMLMKVSTTYEKSLRASIKKFVSFLEPATILGMGLIIGFIVVSMLMAIFSITDLPF